MIKRLARPEVFRLGQLAKSLDKLNKLSLVGDCSAKLLDRVLKWTEKPNQLLLVGDLGAKLRDEVLKRTDHGLKALRLCSISTPNH